MCRNTIFSASVALGLASNLFASVIHVPADQPNIPAAIAAAVNGDEIIVSPGVYGAPIDFMGKTIYVHSVNVHNPAATTLQAPAGNSIVTFNTGEGPLSKLAGFTLNNGTSASGGGVFIGNANPTIENCVIQSCQANNGAGLAVNGGVTMRDCRFIGNQANVTGGGVWTGRNASISLDRCLFDSNQAPSGGALLIQGGATIVNSEIFDNQTAVAIGGAHPVNLLNCTIVNNLGTGVQLAAGATTVTTLSNDIVRLNGGPPQITGPAALLQVRYSDVQGGYAGPGNFDANPMFVNPASGDFRLGPFSPCIDAGENGTIPPGIVEDFTGVQRRTDKPDIPDSGLGTAPIVDIGAHEFPPARRYVNKNATGLNHGMSWGNAYNDLQDALAEAAMPASGILQVFVATGTYRPDGGTNNRNLFFGMLSDVEIIGGFAGGETDASQSDPAAHPTILTGEIGGAATTDNSYNVVGAVNVNANGKLIGFTVQNGHADGPNLNPLEQAKGGGINIDGGAPTIRECWVRQNYAQSQGAGIACLNGAQNVNIVRCRITRNNSDPGGAAGVLVTQTCSAHIVNCLVAGNSAFEAGGIQVNGAAQAEITNCTIVGNAAPGAGHAGVLVLGTAMVSNNIIGFNVGTGPAEGQQFFIVLGGVATLNYNNIQNWSGALGGVGNSGANPLLVDADGPDNIYGTADDNPRLTGASPCLDSADSAAAAGLTVDLDGAPRFVDDPVAANSGVGPVTYLDRGAYEFARPLCIGDIVVNLHVDVDDLLAVITHWGNCPPPCPPHCAADISPAGGNCAVNVDDLLAVITHWGACP